MPRNWISLLLSSSGKKILLRSEIRFLGGMDLWVKDKVSLLSLGQIYCEKSEGGCLSLSFRVCLEYLSALALSISLARIFRFNSRSSSLAALRPINIRRLLLFFLYFNPSLFFLATINN